MVETARPTITQVKKYMRRYMPIRMWSHRTTVDKHAKVLRLLEYSIDLLVVQGDLSVVPDMEVEQWLIEQLEKRNALQQGRG